MKELPYGLCLIVGSRLPMAVVVFLGWTLIAVDPAQAAPEEYPLDSLDRMVKTHRGKVICPKLELINYKGTSIRYHRHVRVHPAFAKRLKRFEKLAIDVAKEIYGRAPRRLKHMGAYNCRRIGGYPEFLSEHALGNGIDVAGFDFGALSRKERRVSKLPRHLQRSFKVRLKDHWTGKGRRAIHARFLNTLARRLVAREDIFRVLLGPSFPGHKTHFHFDVAPWRLVDIW